jgi:hypothetical protein
MVSDLDDPDFRRIGGFYTVAADATRGQFSDRLYMAWSDMRFGRPRLVISFSADRGRSWSEPAMVDGDVPSDTLQYMPRLAVNKDGVVGVLWHDTRDHVADKHYRAYFTASLDGGETFLPSVGVSTAPGDPYGPGNMLPAPSVFNFQGSGMLSMISAASRWAAGGDYIGLDTDSDGTFWPLWPDARTGTFQLYTAELRVETPPPPPPKGMPTPRQPPAAQAEPPALVEASLLDRVEFVFDPTRYDGDTQIVEMPVRFKNVSNDVIYPPITVEVTGFGRGQLESEEEKAKYSAPVVVNADNGEDGVGATFSFDAALDSSGSLAPNALTSPVVIRLMLVDPLWTPPINLAITGRIRK